jgi:hypothetical protein
MLLEITEDELDNIVNNLTITTSARDLLYLKPFEDLPPKYWDSTDFGDVKACLLTRIAK